MKFSILSIILIMSTLFSHVSATSTIINGKRYVSIPWAQPNAAGILNKSVSNIADQLTINKDFKNLSQNNIAIASFVDISNFENAGKLGQIISENLIHEMQVRGFKIVDFKTMDKIVVKNSGDFILSRESEKLRSEYKINLMLTGTLTKYRNGTAVNARIINSVDHTVVSSAQIWLPKRVVRQLIPMGNIVVDKVVIKEVVPTVSPYSVSIE